MALPQKPSVLGQDRPWEKPENSASSQDGCLEQGWCMEQRQVTLEVLSSAGNFGEISPGVLTAPPWALSSAAPGHPSSWRCAASG